MGFQVIPSYCTAHYSTTHHNRTHALKTRRLLPWDWSGAPQRVKSSFSRKREWWPIIFSLLLKWAVTFFLLNKLRLICTVERETTVGNVFKACTHKYHHSLRNRTAGRRGRQITCAWRTWQGYNLDVLPWSWLTSMFSGLLQKDLFKRKWCLEKVISSKIIVPPFTQGLPSSFPLPSYFVSSLNSELTQQDGRKKRTANRLCVTNVTRL